MNRDDERAWFRTHARAPRETAPLLMLLSGPPGSGKTALLLEYGNEADVDAVLYVDLDDYRHEETVDYEDVLGDLIVQLGVGREWVKVGFRRAKSSTGGTARVSACCCCWTT
ncbi:ATP-binding protein [Allokutzneria sp. A3M-2-11 16]|uniref:ATP-binding protein n=1 Tax=Allokutzneria sp. A3M-2-11 16 TaxID=2962043 RepID=UPI0020B6E22F|nr:ATP-binding protein [Allokutzneria sp. A3M-2-11 16]MCP3802723.1 ATP-binding protein [Allokutzneria sp. A3M-2-11 16]